MIAISGVGDWRYRNRVSAILSHQRLGEPPAGPTSDQNWGRKDLWRHENETVWRGHAGRDAGDGRPKRACWIQALTNAKNGNSPVIQCLFAGIRTIGGCYARN